MKLLSFIIIYFLLQVLKCTSSKVKKDITQTLVTEYKNFDTVFPRILNAKTKIGSKSSSSSGIIYRIDSEEDFKSFINNSDLTDKYAIVISAVFVNAEKLVKLEETKKVVGVIVVYDDKPMIKPYSPDKKCPNCEYGMYSGDERANYKWNPHGDGMLFKYFDFPIFGITGNGYSVKDAVLPIIEANIFNKKRKYKNYPLYSIKFDSFMLAPEDTITCLSRKTCDPIGGNSIWSSFSRKIDPNDGKKIVFITAQLDGNSLFHENTIGTNSQIGGIVANLAIADALSRSDIKPEQFQNHIVFMFFNGESFGYGGSQRFVNDISEPFKCLNKNERVNKECSNYASCFNPYMYFDDFKNITLNNIKGIIELNQLTCSGCNNTDSPTYFMHIDDENDSETLKITNLISKVYSVFGNSVPAIPNNNDASNIIVDNNNNIDSSSRNETINKLKRQNTSYNIKPAWEGLIKNLGLPPASSQSFLKKQKIPAVVISDFQTEFTNKFYHSGFDIDSNSTTYDNTVCKTADIIAKSVWLYAQNKEIDYDVNLIPPSVAVNCNYVNELMYCLSHNISCPLAQTLLTSNNSTRQVEGKLSKVSHYSGIFNDYSLNGTLHTYSNFDSWVTNYALITSTGRNTTFPCKYIDDCMKQFEYPNFDELDDESKKKIESMPYSKRKYQCINNFCIEGQAFVHPAYGSGLRYDVFNNKYFVKKEDEATWVESRWSSNSITICFTTSRIFQIFELLVGIVFVILTIIGYYFINTYTKKYLKLA
ncbi:hypothetical protein BCR36DRAFT_341074 [Piromyces finnis]|uniref:Nicastrin n=1 Tax=Piromyces finnis TaxID=1754191 RepID=A0A1Y1VNJ3_9FUNG|nr:hypothetical protein BCR36DRAFT_341074 [Piromyces finnis]|eukprot:ORX60985.1 hypothetical protein BCR36DRAFT_341074 [Piromyces finnis]